MTMAAVSVGMAASAPLVALLGVRGALFSAGAAAIVAAAGALALGLQRLRGDADPGSAPADAGALASGSPLLI
jgi:hypothetical protein